MKTILIADDATVFRRLEEGILRIYGFRFLHAEDGAETVRMAVENEPDLILLDVQMPVMDGVQVLSFLKRHERTKSIPIIVVTTIGRDSDRDLFLRGGADACLTKPIDPPSLVAAVHAQLGGALPKRSALA